MIPSRKGWPFPLPLHALVGFCHSNPAHVYARPVWHAGEALASNGRIAVRAAKGAWLETDFAADERGMAARFELIGWKVWPEASGWWRKADDAPAYVRWRGLPGWPAGWPHQVRVGAGPCVAGVDLAAVARLPRCEVWTGQWDACAPLAFRFSGGRGLIAPVRDDGESFWLFAPRRHEDGTLIGKQAPRPSLPLPGWPPVDATD
jgi:hypothetical protein